ncbi:UNVERIFIED_CONTAM: hypothetical protein Sradi_2033800 [Sesamum radiatum]|uniref:Uncharacterized protein n=1 Tax=Sesamum radiatum TaxID=300843 RepID=A0AAW2TG62_SESRA
MPNKIGKGQSNRVISSSKYGKVFHPTTINRDVSSIIKDTGEDESRGHSRHTELKKQVKTIQDTSKDNSRRKTRHNSRHTRHEKRSHNKSKGTQVQKLSATTKHCNREGSTSSSVSNHQALIPNFKVTHSLLHKFGGDYTSTSKNKLQTLRSTFGAKNQGIIFKSEIKFCVNKFLARPVGQSLPLIPSSYIKVQVTTSDHSMASKKDQVSMNKKNIINTIGQSSTWGKIVDTTPSDGSNSASPTEINSKSTPFAILPAMMINASVMKEQLAQMAQAIANLQKIIEDKDFQIAQLMSNQELANVEEPTTNMPPSQTMLKTRSKWIKYHRCMTLVKSLHIPKRLLLHCVFNNCKR